MNLRFDERGWLRHLEFTAVAAMATVVLCVMIGQSAERYAENAAAPETQAVAIAQSSAAPNKNAPVFNAIDYPTTGSLKGQTVIISPCTVPPASQ